MQTNKEQNQDITAINPDFLPKEYTIEDIRNFEPQLADWIEQRIHQARIDELKWALKYPHIQGNIWIKERIAKLEGGSE